MNKIGTAVIGAGKVGYTHADAYAGVPESRFVAVASRDPAKVADFVAKYGVRGYTDLDAMLADPEVQAVSICTPQGSHVDLAVRAARAGKHVLLEKPMAVDLRGCDAIITACEAAGVKLGIISQRRFYEPVQRVKQAVDAGKIGQPIIGTLEVLGWRDEAYYAMDAWRRHWESAGGGVTTNQTSHQIDLFQWIMGPIDEVFGYAANLNHPYIEVEDTAVAVLRFKNGALGQILVSNSTKPGFWGKIHVHGSTGASVGVQTDGGSPFISGISEHVEPPINDIWTVPGEEHLLAQWQAEDTARADQIDIMCYYHELQVRDFLQAILEDRAPAIDGPAGRKHVEVIMGIFRSQRDGRPVRFPLDAEEGSEQFDGRLAVG